MTKTIYYAAASLDGFIAADRHSLEWLLQFDAGGTGYEEFVAGVGAVAMGAHTFEWLLANHVAPAGKPPQPWPYAVPTWVFTSRRLPAVPGADIRFAGGDVRPVHQQMVLAAAGRNVWIAGGGELVGRFHDACLLDELIVQVTSVTLGRGAPLLPRQIAFPPLRLRSARTIGEAFAELRYEVPRATAAQSPTLLNPAST